MSLISISGLREWAADLDASPSPDAAGTSRLLKPAGLQILAETRILPGSEHAALAYLLQDSNSSALVAVFHGFPGSTSHSSSSHCWKTFSSSK
jgi:hypothetical protein